MTRTLTIDNFNGSMTEFAEGDINSGKTNIVEVFAYDSFRKPGNLTWSESAVQIDAAGAVITDLIMCGKERVESGVLYVYAVGHTGRVYKIQVNDPTSYDPDYDNPVLLTTISSGSPTFTRGGFIDFFGATEKIYIGHDKGVTSLNFDGTGESAISGTWTQTVPRPLQQFVGKLYIGNGNNIAEIDSTGTVTSSTKLSPGFPSGTQVRDIDLSTDGNYIFIVVSRLALANITSPTQDTSTTSNLESYIFKWNGIDAGYTASDNFPLINLTTNVAFQGSQYVFGYDLRGATFFDPINRMSPNVAGDAAFGESPFPNAVISDGQTVGFATSLFFANHWSLSYCMFGSFDWEIGRGYWSPFGMEPTSPETDIVRVPFWHTVSNLGVGLSYNGYPNNIFGTSKIYFSTLEASGTPTTAYRFYTWSAVTTGLRPPVEGAVYQTQTQLFSKKVTLKEVRVYGEPWVSGNSFQIDLVGSGGDPITGSTKTFTVGGLSPTLTAGDDFAWYSPDCAPTYAVALRVTNLGETNHVISKVEIDYDIGGK